MKKWIVTGKGHCAYLNDVVEAETMRKAAEKALKAFFARYDYDTPGAWKVYVKKYVEGQKHDPKKLGKEFKATAFRSITVRVW